MSSLHSLFKMSPEAEQKGVVISYGKPWFRCARAGGSNARFRTTWERNMRPHRRAEKLGVLSDEVSDEVSYRTFAESVILEWGGVTRRDLGEEEGDLEKEVPFTQENAMKLFRNLPDLFLDLMNQTIQGDAYRADLEELEAKN